MKRNRTLTKTSWLSMRTRCNRENSHNYHSYGGRGIKICNRWNDFSLFLLDMGERPENTTLDRIDPDGNYEKSNCRWADSKKQARNKRTSILTEINGNLLNLVDIADFFEVPRTTVYRRYHQGIRGLELIDKANRNKYRIGEKSSSSKLKSDQVLQIRKMFKSGIKVSEIRKLFPVSQPVISDIVNHKTWTHI